MSNELGAMQRHLMIDFETLSLAQNAVLLSLGAVVVDPLTDSTESFSINIDPRSQPGGKIDASIVLWWLGQASKNPDAAKPLLDAIKLMDDDLPEDYTAEQEEDWYRNKAYSLDHAAQMFLGFCQSLPEWSKGRDGAGCLDMECWANGAVDHGWLDHMLTSTGLKNPIPYWNQRDYRTLKAMHPGVKADEHPELVRHTALGDAMHQALHLAKLLRHQHGYPTPQYPGHDPFMPADEVWEQYPWAMFAATDWNGETWVFDAEPENVWCAEAGSSVWDYNDVPYTDSEPVASAAGAVSDEASAASLRHRPERLIAKEPQAKEPQAKDDQPRVVVHPEDDEHRPI